MSYFVETFVTYGMTQKNDTITLYYMESHYITLYERIADDQTIAGITQGRPNHGLSDVE